jgi:hypothetical protein
MLIDKNTAGNRRCFFVRQTVGSRWLDCGSGWSRQTDAD